MSRWPSAAAWAALGLGTAAGTLALEALGIPSPTLMAALLVGIAWALRGPGAALDPPKAVSTGAEAVLGVAIGAYVELETLKALGADLPAVLVINLATLVLSVLAGTALHRMARRDVDEPTAAFGMIAGGASGIVAMSRELGADQRLVAVMQYLRVLVIVLLTPVVAVLVYGASGDTGTVTLDEITYAETVLLIAVSVGIGLPIAKRLGIPAGSVLGPMTVAAALTVSGAPFAGALPPLVQDVAFAVIGLIVGLRFTPDSLKAAGRLLGPALLCIFGVLIGCALVGAALAPLAGVSQLDAYLATTPGGLYAVLATAVGSDADATFVLAVQVLRLLVMLLAAPLLARRLTAAAPARSAAPPPPR